MERTRVSAALAIQVAAGTTKSRKGNSPAYSPYVERESVAGRAAKSHMRQELDLSVYSSPFFLRPCEVAQT